jgi:hypothetical protein
VDETKKTEIGRTQSIHGDMRNVNGTLAGIQRKKGLYGKLRLMSINMQAVLKFNNPNRQMSKQWVP